ncbi:MAG TPA: Gfo/Idh/MocA family oxidoreductase [Solirubrobacteraceae bacterium]|nr:Gfo/Idh/MocA family oxidoreductase [Solirubrobacteraceae bacterium]
MPGEPVKIAVFGGGYGAKVALPVLADMDEFQPVAVWSRTPERARELAASHDLALGTTDVEELLAHPGLEAVHVATPVATHAEIATAAARRGLHVLLDKPVAMDLTQARAVRDAVAEAGVVGAVNYGRRFQETRDRLLQRVAEVAGAPRMVSIALVFDDHALPESRPFTWVQDARLGGGRLQGYGVHDLDLLLAAFGEVDSVAAATEVGVKERRAPDGSPQAVTAEDAYAILIRFRGGGLGHVSLTATARHKRGDVIEVHGDEGTVRLDAEKRLHWGRAGEELQVEGPLEADSKQAYAQVARNFHAAIRDGAAPDPGLDRGLRVQALTDAVRRAHAERRWVEPERV